VPERVVHVLEPVEVDDEDRDAALVALSREERLLRPVVEERPVGQAGERVVQRLELVLLRLALEPARRARDDPEEHGVQEREAPEQQEVRRERVVGDRGADGRIREVDLERALRWARTVESQRHVDLEQLAVAAVVGVLGVVESAHLRRDVVVERLPELGGGREDSADEPVVVGVDDAPVAVPDLDPCDLAPNQVDAKGAVEDLEPLRRQAVSQVGRRQERLDAEARREERGLARIRERPPLGLSGEVVPEGDSEQRDREGAREPERPQESESGSVG